MDKCNASSTLVVILPGLASRMKLSFWGRQDFLISFPNRDTLMNAWTRHWGSFMVDFIKQYEVALSRMLNDTLQPDHIQWQPFTDQTLYQSVSLLPNLTFLPNYKRFPCSICDGCGIPTGEAYSHGHMVPSHLVHVHVLLVETNPFSESVVIFPNYAFRKSLGTFLILFCIMKKIRQNM